MNRTEQELLQDHIKYTRQVLGQLRKDLTDEQKAEALRIGRISYASAGARREK